jgi:large subunit ribosomal protein L7/L12
MAMMAAPAAGAGEAAEEKTSFNIELTSAGSNKIAVIKAVREITQLGLKEAKDMVDGAPVNVKEGVSKEEGGEIKKKLEEAGGTATLK